MHPGRADSRGRVASASDELESARNRVADLVAHHHDGAAGAGQHRARDRGPVARGAMHPHPSRGYLVKAVGKLVERDVSRPGEMPLAPLAAKTKYEQK